MLPSKLPTVAAEQVDLLPGVLQQSCPVSRPLAGMPTALKLNASVPTGEKSSWFSPIESKYAIAWSRATVDAL